MFGFRFLWCRLNRIFNHGEPIQIHVTRRLIAELIEDYGPRLMRSVRRRAPGTAGLVSFEPLDIQDKECALRVPGGPSSKQMERAGLASVERLASGCFFGPQGKPKGSRILGEVNHPCFGFENWSQASFGVPSAEETRGGGGGPNLMYFGPCTIRAQAFAQTHISQPTATPVKAPFRFFVALFFFFLFLFWGGGYFYFLFLFFFWGGVRRDTNGKPNLFREFPKFGA